MTVNAQKVMTAVSERLHDVTAIEEGVWRGIRRHGNKPYAIYYIDLTDKIEERAETLSEFQDRVLGKHFFDSTNDLRWNSYLLLIADEARFADKNFQRARSLLEANRDYARKFVISQDEVSIRIDAPLPVSDSEQSPKDIIGRWERLLLPVGLGDVLDEGDIAPIIRQLIERPPLEKAVLARKRTQIRDDRVASGFLTNIKLERWRSYPRIPDVVCGTVNLIQGVNGAGKTSLLEAIEYFYCKGTRRPGVPSNARVVCAIRGLRAPVETTADTPAQVFRDRNLAWYGKLDITRNYMPESFGTYNFLNTDAAVRLSIDTSAADLEKDLATLLVGSEAARVWGRLERIMRDLPAEQRLLEREVKTIEARVAADQQRLANAQTTPHESDEIFRLLIAHLTRLGWKQLPSSKEQATDETELGLVALEAALRSGLSLPDLPSPLNPSSITAELSRNHLLLEQADGIQKELNPLQSQRKNIATAIQHQLALEGDVRDLSEFIFSGYIATIEEAEQLRSEIARDVSRIPIVHAENVSLSDASYASMPLKDLRSHLVAREHGLADAENTAKQLFDAFQSQKSERAVLAKELRALAERAIEKAPHSDKCPLCHSTFGPGELHQRMYRELDSGDAARESELSLGLRRLAQEHTQAQDDLTIVEQLLAYIQSGASVEGITFAAALTNLTKAATGLKQARERLTEVQARLEVLEVSGFSQLRFQALRSKLALDAHDSVALDKFIGAYREKLAARQFELTQLDVKILQLEEELNALAQDMGTDASITGKSVVDVLQQRVSNLLVARRSVTDAAHALGIADDQQLVETMNELRLAGGAQERLRFALKSENASDESISDAIQSLDAARHEHIRVSESLARLKAARSAIDQVWADHSLEAESRGILKANRSKVAAIFARIHAPREFEVAEIDDALLQRTATKEPIKLDMVSSGQRAAFALSLFLAMNARATRAPPVLLIDDPVAHVDDLNTLSFLDYLRDIAATGTRQIFFATADEKLAALFLHKFSFLAGEFRNQVLGR